MRTVLVDVGNSRIKWAERSADGVGAMVARAHGGDPCEALRTVLADTKASRVVMVDVTGLANEAAAGCESLILVHAEAQGHGVRNAYPVPGRLGADRWAALVGARRNVPGPVCIVDAGTALTFDIMDGEGNHLGGWIVPGMRLAVASLLSSTKRIHLKSDHYPDELAPGRDTETAVMGGVLHGVLGFLARAREVAETRLGTPSTLILTGGDSAVLAPHIENARVMDDLVLQGLVSWVEGTA